MIFEFLAPVTVKMPPPFSEMGSRWRSGFGKKVMEGKCVQFGSVKFELSLRYQRTELRHLGMWIQGSRERNKVIYLFVESWTIKKAEHQRIDAFELWCWRRLLKVPWTARRSNQSILKEINCDYSLNSLKSDIHWILNLKLQYSGHLMQRADSMEKALMLGKIEGKRGRGNRG